MSVSRRFILFCAVFLAGECYADFWQREVNELKRGARGTSEQQDAVIPGLEAIARNDAATLTARLDACWTLETIWWRRQENQKLWDNCALAESLVRQLEPQSIRIKPLARIANVYGSRGKPEEVIRIRTDVIRLAEESGEFEHVADSYRRLATIHSRLGNHTQAAEAFRNSIAYASRLEDKVHLKTAYDEALNYFTQRQTFSINEATRLMDEVSARFPSWARSDIMLRICDEHLGKGDHASAISVARRGVCMIQAGAVGIDASVRLQAKLVETLAAMGRTEDALVEAKRYYMISGMQNLGDAIQIAASAISRHHTNNDELLERFIEHQHFTLEQNEHRRNPLAAVRLVNPEEHEFLDRLQAELDPLDSQARGYMHLLRGDAEAALAEMRAAYSLADGSNLAQAVNGVATALQAVDGNSVRAVQYMLYQKHGPAGADGKPGTADDLQDPLANTTLKLPTERIASLENAIARCDRDNAGTRRRALLLFALGRNGEARHTMLEIYALPRADSRATLTAITDMAGVIKAVDGHIFRANRYLLYHQQGRSGLSGIVGTDDEIRNPLLEEAIAAMNTDDSATMKLELPLERYQSARISGIKLLPEPASGFDVEAITTAVNAAASSVRLTHAINTMNRSSLTAPDDMRKAFEMLIEAQAEHALIKRYADQLMSSIASPAGGAFTMGSTAQRSTELHKAALQGYMHLLQHAPEPDTLETAFKLCIEIGDLDARAQEFRKRLDQGDDWLAVITYRLERARGRTDEAAELLAKVIAEPGRYKLLLNANTAALREAFDLLLRTQRFDTARELLENVEATTLRQSDTRIMMLRFGEELLNAQRIDDGRNILNEVIRRFPNTDTAHQANILLIRATARDADEERKAVEDAELTELARRAANTPRLYLSLGNAYTQAKRYQEAREAYLRTVRFYGDAEAHFAYVRTYFYEGNLEEGADAAIRHLLRFPLHTGVRPWVKGVLLKENQAFIWVSRNLQTAQNLDAESARPFIDDAAGSIHLMKISAHEHQQHLQAIDQIIAANQHSRAILAMMDSYRSGERKMQDVLIYRKQAGGDIEPEYIFNTRQQVGFRPEGGVWQGPDHFSATLSLAWDDVNLYIFAEVRDSIHLNNMTGADIWNGDAIQVAFLPPSPQHASLFEFGLALTTGGTVFHQWEGRSVRQAKYSVQRREQDKLTSYELALPFDELGIPAKHGAAFALNVSINNANDATGLQTYFSLTPGILFGKDPILFRTFLLHGDKR